MIRAPTLSSTLKSKGHQQGPRRHFDFGWAKKISEAATYIKFEFSKNKIRTYSVNLKMLGANEAPGHQVHIYLLEREIS